MIKKIIAIASLSVFVISCKKESKTITKIDPTTGDTIKIEVKSEEDSLKMAKEMAAKAAIKDSAGLYIQSLALEKGKTYPFITSQKDEITMTMPDGKKQSVTRVNTDEVTFTVNDFKDKIYDVTINFKDKKITQSGNGKTESVDTKQAAPKDQALKNRWTIDKAMTGNTLKMKIDHKGKIISISGFEPIYQKFSSTVNGLTKNSEERNMLLQQLKASFSEEVLKEQFTKNIFIFPKKGVKIGEKWTTYENASSDGKVKIQTHFTLKSIKDGVAEIVVTGGIPKQSNKETQQGITQTLSYELTQNGIYRFDINTGWILNQDIQVKTTKSETLSDGKQTQSQSSNTVTHVMVNKNL